MHMPQYILIAIDITGKSDTYIIRRFSNETEAWAEADALNAIPSIWYHTVYTWEPGESL